MMTSEMVDLRTYQVVGYGASGVRGTELGLVGETAKLEDPMGEGSCEVRIAS